MRIFLTGGTGFIGSHTARALVREGSHDVAVLVRPGTDTWRLADIASRLTMIEGDLHSPEDCRADLERFAPEAVGHLAWCGVLGADRDDVRQDDNTQATLACVRLAHNAGARRWIGMGSQAEYGPLTSRVDETAPTRPATRYGHAKLAACRQAEQLCASLGMRFAWLRLFSCYGPQDHPSWLVPYVALSLLRRERPAVTAGEQLWDYLYVSDAAQAIGRTIETADATGVFNLASGRAESIRRIATMVRDCVDPLLPIGFGETSCRHDQPMHLEADITRLRRVTGWQPRIDLSIGLAKTVAWYQALLMQRRIASWNFGEKAAAR